LQLQIKPILTKLISNIEQNNTGVGGAAQEASQSLPNGKTGCSVINTTFVSHFNGERNFLPHCLLFLDQIMVVNVIVHCVVGSLHPIQTMYTALAYLAINQVQCQ